ncbi:MAG: methyl-accepting chemotaxis protein [Thiotrichales bacterium]|nr:methyl-accepting chemotaxis protein [Thiotrichales bacterium]
MKQKHMSHEQLDKLSNVTGLTNLLALNTMLEAARIGHEGQGFATVAEEIMTIGNKTVSNVSVSPFRGRRAPDIAADELDTAMHDQLDAMQDLNHSMSSITQLSAEITRSPGCKQLPKKEFNHLYEILGKNMGKDIA